jgi:hypothetical protein
MVHLLIKKEQWLRLQRKLLDTYGYCAIAAHSSLAFVQVLKITCRLQSAILPHPV